MKLVKMIAVLLCVVLLFAGCRSEVAYSPDTVLTYRLRDMDVQVRLSEEEARLVAGLFDDHKAAMWFSVEDWKLKYMEYGCPFDDYVNIRIGDTTCYIGYDGCRTVRIGEAGNVPHIELSAQEEEKLLDIFRKYTGLDNPY